MKKKVLITSILMSFAIVACGDAKATNAEVEETQTQEQVQQAQEQGLKQEQEQATVQGDVDAENIPAKNNLADVEIGKEYSNGEIVIKVEDTIEEYGLHDDLFQKTEGTITTTEEVPIFCEDGYQIGHINQDVTIEITEHGVNSGAWYRFSNPIEGTPFDFIYVASFMTDMSNIKLLPGTIIPGEYNFEIKDEYDHDEVQNIFTEILKKNGMVSDYSRFDYDDGLISVMIPLKNTVEWAEEKKDLFLEKGISYFSCSGSGFSDYAASVQLQLMDNTGKILSDEELEELFQNDVDLEMKQRNEEEYQQYLEQQKNNN